MQVRNLPARRWFSREAFMMTLHLGKSQRMTSAATAEGYLEQAIRALQDADGFHSVLDALPVPTYLTGPDGAVTYWNRACVEFAGREPELGQDRWCITWRIHTTNDEHLPHDQCPMAQAIRQREPIRGKVAIAIRPDGTRRAFTPYPTPLFDGDGNMTGAVNMLIDVTDEQAGELTQQADRCRRLSRATHDRGAADVLSQMASAYDNNAAALRTT